MEPEGNSIGLSSFKIWFKRSDKSSIADVQLGSKYASVNTTLQLTFLKRT